jgi:nitrite reductase (NADH) large subunit
MLHNAEKEKNVVIIGGGVLGLEVGNSLRKTGHKVSIVEFFSRLLPRQMDPEGAELLKAQMENMGFTFYLGATSKEITGMNNAEGILLQDGTKIDCNLIIISAGVRPQVELAKKLGLKINKGLIVNDRMETEIKDIYAAGDLIEHREIFYGIWHAAQKQGETAGINMAGRYDSIPRESALYTGTTLSSVLKVVGIDLAAVLLQGILMQKAHVSPLFKKIRTRIFTKNSLLKITYLQDVFYMVIYPTIEIFSRL